MYSTLVPVGYSARGIHQGVRNDANGLAKTMQQEQRKKQKKQTSRDLVPKKDVKGGRGVGGTTPSNPSRRRRAKAQRWLCGESDSRRQFASEVGYLGFPSSTKNSGTRNFLPSEQKAGKISRTENRTAKCLSERERENFNHAVFALAFFSRRQDRESPGAISRGLLDCPCRL